MRLPISRGLELAGLYLVTTGAGWAFSIWRIPLPWMIGPLVISAALYVSGVLRRPVPVQTRPFGQMTVAAQVGLAFTPAALGVLFELAPLLIGTALISACCALVVGVGLARATGMRLPQSILATFPTSPVEAAIMAQKYGCDPAPVILSQTVRIASVVILVPMSVYLLDGWPDRSIGSRISAGFDLADNCLLAGLAVTGAIVFRRLGLSNPYFLGPLVASAAIAATGIALTPFPRVLLAAAQVVLGTWLGSTFRRELFMKQPRIVVASIASAVLLLAVVSACALALAFATGLDWEVMVLGAAPGGVTEMALTAKYLGVDLALVTAFQLIRILIFMPNIPWIIYLIDRYEARRSRG